jgi:hypothetical protein
MRAGLLAFTRRGQDPRTVTSHSGLRQHQRRHLAAPVFFTRPRSSSLNDRLIRTSALPWDICQCCCAAALFRLVPEGEMALVTGYGGMFTQLPISPTVIQGLCRSVHMSCGARILQHLRLSRKSTGTIPGFLDAIDNIADSGAISTTR